MNLFSRILSSCNTYARNRCENKLKPDILIHGEIKEKNTISVGDTIKVINAVFVESGWTGMYDQSNGAGEWWSRECVEPDVIALISVSESFIITLSIFFKPKSDSFSADMRIDARGDRAIRAVVEAANVFRDRMHSMLEDLNRINRGLF